MTRQTFLTLRAKRLYRTVIEKTSQLSKEVEIREVESDPIKAEKVNQLTYRFIVSQVHTQKQKRKARRFATDEKVLALTILMASGKGYKLLSKTFTLPSKKAL